MKQHQSPIEVERSRYHAALAAVVIEVGCLTPVIILAAIFLGRWLDNYFSSGRTFTIIVIVASIPICLIIMFALVKLTLARILPPQKASENAEENYERRTS